MINLFGEEVPDIDPPKHKDLAHPAPPGSGPEGKTCRKCQLLRKTGHHDKTYYKCSAVKASHGPATDCRLKTPACSWFKEKR